MANRYKQVTNTGSESHFSAAVVGELAYSRMHSDPLHLTTFNAGDIVPIYCLEVLPHDTIGVDMDFVIRQSTLLTPTMGNMTVDFYAFFVPNRVVNQSWKTVMGENPNGSWTAPQITLAPLYDASKIDSPPSTIQVPVGSVADYYGFPTQQGIPTVVLSQMHDLKFRGYVEIYNEFFRDQNYQPPIAYSKLNIYNDFFHTTTSSYIFGEPAVDGNYAQDNSYGFGAVSQAIYGNLTPFSDGDIAGLEVESGSVFNALGAPLKANKLHDYFTSVLPTSQKGPSVLLPLSGNAPVLTGSQTFTQTGQPLRWQKASGTNLTPLDAYAVGILADTATTGSTGAYAGTAGTSFGGLSPSNLYADLSQVSAATISDLRTAAAVQQVYEQLARSGSRYREYVRAFFALEVDDPYKDIPTYLGHIRRDLDLYQTAQTSSSETGGTPQGNLAAFGYTANSGNLFDPVTFLEHGYIHILAVVRHKNIYSSFLARDNFRLNMLDWYQPPLANISEQPVYTREINPFVSTVDSSRVFGYQEAWAEYRYDPDYVSGLMRPFGETLPPYVGGGTAESVSLWNYADNFNSALSIATGSWLESNSRDVLNRSLAVTSDVAQQFKGQFRFRIDKERPMPTYSIPGLDIF